VRFDVLTAMKIQVVVSWDVTPCSYVLGYHFTLKMEAAYPSETLVSCHISTWCHTPEDCNL